MLRSPSHSPREAGEDLDFEDLLDSFERKFAKKLAERAAPDDFEKAPKVIRPPSFGDSRYSFSDSRFDVCDFTDELGLLLEEVLHNARLSRQIGGHPITDDENDRILLMDDAIGREVIRAEIRMTMEKVRQIEWQTRDGANLKASAQKTTISSLRRQLRESREECESLAKAKKQSDLTVRNLEDVINEHVSKNTMLGEKIQLVETESQEQESKIKEAEDTIKSLSADKKRLERNVAMLRKELLDSHHRVSEQKLKVSQSDRRAQELEQRANEMKISEAALSERVKELHDVQGKMLAEMKKVVESKDAPAARRALANLSQQRSRIVGRIANIMTKRGQTATGEGDENATPEAAADDGELGDDGAGDDTQEAGTANHSEHETVATEFGNSEADLSRRTSLLGRFQNKERQYHTSVGDSTSKTGHLSPTPYSRSGRQQIYENNLERSREAAERDSEALREVLDLKSSEIDRLDTELKKVKGEAATLERELHSERQNRRKENRNLRIAGEDEARKHISHVVQLRNKPQSLFEWQASVELNKST